MTSLMVICTHVQIYSNDAFVVLLGQGGQCFMLAYSRHMVTAVTSSCSAVMRASRCSCSAIGFLC